MSPISPADSNIVPRREFIRDQHPASSFSILALSGAALLRLYSFPPDAVLALRKHLDSAHLILSSRELIQNNFCELSLDGKPWSNPKSARTEKLLIDILYVLYRNDYNFLSTLDYGREQDDRIVMAFSRPSSPPPPPAAVPPLPAVALAPFHKKSNDSLTVVPHSVKVPFAISFISQNVLRVIAPPLHLTPAILQTVRGSWPRGVVSEKKVAENVYEFKFKGYGWFQEDTFATDSLRHILSLLRSLDVFGFTLLTSLSLNGRSRFKDLWVFLGLSQTMSTESRPSSPLDSRTDLKVAPSDRFHVRRGSHPAPANLLPSTNPRGHTRAASSNIIPSSGQISSKSGVVRKPAPRAQLPVSVAQSTASNDNIPDAATPTQQTTHAEQLRMELQSSVGSAEDMTGVGTHKYGGQGRTDEPDESLYQRMPSRFYGNLHFSGTPAPVVKAPPTTGPPRSAQPLGGATAGRLDAQPTAREANPASIPSRSRPSPQKAASQSKSPTPPLLSPRAFRDSAISSNTSQTADWAGAGKENGHSVSGPRNRDPRENLLPGGWISAPTGIKESKAPGEHPNPNESHRHKHAMTSLSQPEEQEVKAGTPELVHPKLRPARSGKATLVTEAPRAEIHGAKAADRLPPPAKSTPVRRDHNPAKVPAEGWVLVNVGQPGQPGMPGAPQATHPPSQHGLQRKQSFPPMSPQRPLATHSPYSTGSRGTHTGFAVGNHKKAQTNYNPSSMSPAAKAIVVFDAIEAKRKAAAGDAAPQSSFRKFFSLSRPDSPSKSPGKDRKLALASGGSKSKLLEQEDGTNKREGAAARERWRTRGMPEGTKSNHRRMSVD